MAASLDANTSSSPLVMLLSEKRRVAALQYFLQQLPAHTLSTLWLDDSHTECTDMCHSSPLHAIYITTTNDTFVICDGHKLDTAILLEGGVWDCSGKAAEVGLKQDVKLASCRQKWNCLVQTTSRNVSSRS